MARLANGTIDAQTLEWFLKDHELLALAQDLRTHQTELVAALKKLDIYPPALAALGKEGVALKLLTRLFTALLQAGGNEEQVLELLTPIGDDFFAALMRRFKPAKEIEVQISKDATLDGLYALGRFERIYWDTTPRLADFKIQPGPERVTLLLVRPFRYGGECEQSIAYGTCLSRRNLQPARIEHLLAAGAQYPEIARQHTLIALGSTVLHKDAEGYEEWVSPYTSESTFKALHFGFTRPVFYGGPMNRAPADQDIIVLALKPGE